MNIYVCLFIYYYCSVNVNAVLVVSFFLIFSFPYAVATLNLMSIAHKRKLSLRTLRLTVSFLKYHRL